MYESCLPCRQVFDHVDELSTILTRCLPCRRAVLYHVAELSAMYTELCHVDDLFTFGLDVPRASNWRAQSPGVSSWLFVTLFGPTLD